MRLGEKMAQWGSVYFVDAKVCAQDIWTFIVKTFRDIVPFSLPEEVSENLFFKNSNFAFSWNNTEEDSLRFTNFDFTGTLNGNEEYFHLIFEKNSTSTLKKHVLRHIVVREIYKGSGLPICYSFMPFVKPFVPKKLLLDDVVDETWYLHKAASQMNIEKEQSFFNPEDLLAKIGEQSAKQSFNTFGKFGAFDTIEDFRNSYMQNKSPKNKAKSELEKSLYIVKNILFYADENDRFWFDESWILRFCSEMWFLNAHFNRFSGVNTYIKHLLPAMSPSFRKMFERHHLSPELLEIKEKAFADSAKDLMRDQPKTWRREAHITLRYPDGKEVYFTKDNTDFSSYESLRDTLVGAIEMTEEQFLKHINTRFENEEIVETEEKISNSVRQNVDYFLAEHKIDVASISALRSDYESLKKENEALKKENDAMKKKYCEEVSSLEKKLRNASLPLPTLSERNDSFEKDVAELKQALKASESEKNQLKESVSALEKLLDTSGNDSEGESITLCVPSKLSPLFKTELSDYLYSLLYGALESEKEALPENRADEVSRKRDVVSDLFSCRTFKKENCESQKKIERIAAILRSDAKFPLDSLLAEGFGKVEGAHNHPKYYFHDEKYQMTFPSTPSDSGVAWRQIRDLCKCLFLV